jgi:hypothetical protein
MVWEASNSSAVICAVIGIRPEPEAGRRAYRINRVHVVGVRAVSVRLVGRGACCHMQIATGLCEGCKR